MQGQVPGEPVQPFHHPEQEVELPGVEVQPVELRELRHGFPDVMGPDVGEGLGGEVHLSLREAERLAHLPDGPPGPVGVHHGHAGAAVVAVPGEDRVVHLLPAGRFHVDVDVRQLVAERIDEPLEQQPVADRVHVGDAGQVAHQRSGRRPPARGADPHGPDVRADVGDRQEVRGVPHRLDLGELVVQAVTDLPGGLHPSVSHAAPAPLGEDRPRAASGRRGELREVDPPEADVELAAFGDVEGAIAHVAAPGEQRPHRGGRLEESLRVAPGDMVGGEPDELPHAFEDVGQERVLGNQVSHGVRCHRLDARPLRHLDEPSDLRRAVRLQAMLDLQEQVGSEGVSPRAERCHRLVEPA